MRKLVNIGTKLVAMPIRRTIKEHAQISEYLTEEKESRLRFVKNPFACVS